MTPQRTTLFIAATLAAGVLLVNQAPLATGAEHGGSASEAQGAEDRGARRGAERGAERGDDREPRGERRAGKNGRGGPGPGPGLGSGSDSVPEPMTLTEEQVEDALALMIELDPAIAPNIAMMRVQRPEHLRRAVSRRFPRVSYMLKLKESRPEVYALRVKDIRLENLSKRQARALAVLPQGDAGVDAARAALRSTLEEHFVVRQDVRRVELAALREKLSQMEARLSTDEAQRGAMIEKRLADLEASPAPHGAARDRERRHGRQGEAARGQGPRGERARGQGAAERTDETAK